MLDGSSNLQKKLAENFRKERLRLGLSTADVAHFCCVSASSIFGWEAGRSKIPLSALANLWEHGFSPEAIVGGAISMQPIRVLCEGEDLESAQSECFVPMHMLFRHRVNSKNAFAYQNKAFAQDIAAPGDLMLMGALNNDYVKDLDSETFILFRPRNTSLNEFLCRVKPAGKGRVHLHAGGKASTVALRPMLESGEAIGEYCYRLGFRQFNLASSMSHAQRLSKFFKLLKG